MEEKKFVNTEKIQQEFNDYKKFAFGKNLFAMALALIMANSMQKFVTAISESIIMPIIKFTVTATGGDWRLLIFSPTNGMDFEIGKFIGSFLEFTITTILLYIIYIKIIKRFDPEASIH